MSKRPLCGLLFIYLAWLVLPQASAKTYDRCELARELLFKYRLPAQQISQWICLVRWESNYNTSAIGSLNGDGSLDHGLFQISDNYWCNGASGRGEACGLDCHQLRDDDIKDDVTCAKRVFRQHQKLTGNGFNAWVAWRIHCQGDTQSYTADCFDQELADSTDEFQEDAQDEAVAYWTIVDMIPWLVSLVPDWFI